MKAKTKVALAAIVIICLTIPTLGLAEPITVTSNGNPTVTFSSYVEGECLVQTESNIMETPNDYHFASGDINFTGNAIAEQLSGASLFGLYNANQSVNAEGRALAEWNNSQTIDVQL
jgi:hypothetical protein